MSDSLIEKIHNYVVEHIGTFIVTDSLGLTD